MNQIAIFSTIVFDKNELFVSIFALATSLPIGLLFLFLHFWWQRKWYEKKKTHLNKDETLNKIVDFCKRNIFMVFACIFLFTSLTTVLWFITKII